MIPHRSPASHGIKLWRWVLIVCIIILIPMAVLGVGMAQAPESDIARVLPAAEECTGETVQLNGKVSGVFSQTFQLDPVTGLYQMAILSDIFEFHGTYTRGFKVVQSEFIFRNKDHIKYLGYDRRETLADEAGQGSVKYFLNDQLKSEKRFCNDAVIDSDVVLFFLQAMLAKGMKNFDYDLFGKKDGLKVTATFRLVAATDFVELAPEYHFPENLRRLSARKNEVWVYIMELKGLSRMFYPHKYYYVYQKESHHLIAYWGGALPEAEYAYIVDAPSRK